LIFGEGLGSQWELCGASGGDKGSILQTPMARYDMTLNPKTLPPVHISTPLTHAVLNILSTFSNIM
jgi:hypothetical protein